MHLKHQYPFYKTYVDIQCRKDILGQNEHVNKKTTNKITPFFKRVQKQAKLNKYRLIYFFGFVVLFKMEPIYDYVFCQNKALNWITNNFINYYTDYTIKIPDSHKQISIQKKLIKKSQTNKKLAQLYYKIDINPVSVIGYNDQDQNFNKRKQQEISLEQFIKICNMKFANNLGQVQSNLRNLYPECFN